MQLIDGNEKIVRLLRIITHQKSPPGNDIADFGVGVATEILSPGHIIRLEGKLRNAQPAPQANDLDNGSYAFNTNRQAHGTLWTRERYAVLNAYLQDIPIGWRFFVKHQLFDLLARHVATEGDVPGVAIVQNHLDDLSLRYPAMIQSAA